MDNKEKSIEELCQAFDKIIGSDNEAVQRMFRHLLTLVELTDQNHDENKSLIGMGLRHKGPFSSLFDRLDQLERRVNNMSKNSSSAGTMSGIDTITLSGITQFGPTSMTTHPIPSLNAISISDLSISFPDLNTMNMASTGIDNK